MDLNIGDVVIHKDSPGIPMTVERFYGETTRTIWYDPNYGFRRARFFTDSLERTNFENKTLKDPRRLDRVLEIIKGM